jgi:type I restriction enzyme R subunit
MGEKREIELLDLGGASSLAQFRKKARAYVDAHADHVTLARLRQGKPLTPTDLDELQRLFAEAGIASDAEFARIRALPDLPEFIRSLVGLDRKAAQIAFNHALALITLSAEQIRFVEMIIDHLTSSGRMEPELLYAPPFTDRAPNGVSDVFDGAAVEAILDLLEEMNPRLAASV